jgi:hypothetical protein
MDLSPPSPSTSHVKYSLMGLTMDLNPPSPSTTLLESSSPSGDHSSMGSTMALSPSSPSELSSLLKSSSQPPCDYFSTDSTSKNDTSPGTILPVDWPIWIKHLVLLQVVSHASMASWCSAAIVRHLILSMRSAELTGQIPALMDMSIQFGVEMKYMTYFVGAYTMMMGFGVRSLHLSPLSALNYEL